MRRHFAVTLCALLLSCGDGAGPTGPDGGTGAPDLGGIDQARHDQAAADQAATDQQAAPDQQAPKPGDGIFDGCRGWKSCKAGQVCNLTLGRCEQRYDWTGPAPTLTAYHPLSAAAGDTLVIDGTRLWSNALFPSIKVTVGGVAVQTSPPLLDPTRVLVPVTKALSGSVVITTDTGVKLTAKLALKQAAAGQRACDKTTPTASGKNGATVDDAGPHAAGFVDLTAHVARLYYPAQCGGLRRPPVNGTWPLVVLLHGNGAGWLNYEYLGQFLATWGLVSVLPDAKVDYKASDPVQISQAQVQTLTAVIKTVRGKALSSVAGWLSGVKTTSNVAWIGHSRGTARIQAVIGADAGLAAATKAVVFLGPVDDGKVVPGLFLLLAGTHDAQSPAFIYDAAYARQKAPKWKVVVQGGNHSLFSDHKVWTGFLDKKPTVTRQQQLAVITSFALPLLQRGFGLKQPFGKRLDSPPASPLYKVTHAK